MKRIYTYKKFIQLCSLLVATVSFGQTEIYDYSGSEVIYTVPPGAGSVQITAKGAKGTDNSGGIGGNGAIMIGTFAVTPGEELTVYAGGNPVGINAAGDGSYVAHEDGTLMIAAGGGGGGAFSAGGAAPVSEDGTAPPIHIGSPGGTGGSGGVAGTDEWGTGGGGGWLTDGGDGLGSDGGAAPCRASVGTTFAGGAGGGYSGGGGVRMFSGDGTGGGGAGGSYNDGTDQDNTAGANAGLGQVTITVLCFPLTITVSDYDLCIGQYLTLEASSETGGITSWDGDVVDGEPFLPGTPGTYNYLVTSTSGEDCAVEIEVIVHENPPVVANAAPSEVCEGDALLLYGSGADVYEWDPGTVTDGEVIYPEAGSMIYTVIGMDEFGCVSLDEVEVVVYAAPEVSIITESTKACVGGEITLSGTGAVTYDWSDGIDDGEPFIATETGVFTYEVTGESEIGCEGEASIEITVNEPIEITYTTTEELFGGDGEIDITVTGGFTPYSYDWDNDGTGDFDDDEDLTDIAGGTYVVVVESDGNCSGTETMSVGTQLSIVDLGNESVEIYPNPFHNQFNLKLPGSFTYEITSMTGQVVLLGNGTDQKLVDLSGYANGIYLITLNNSTSIYSTQILKN
jgi:hypothetical protein